MLSIIAKGELLPLTHSSALSFTPALAGLHQQERLQPRSCLGEGRGLRARGVALGAAPGHPCRTGALGFSCVQLLVPDPVIPGERRAAAGAGTRGRRHPRSDR